MKKSKYNFIVAYKKKYLIFNALLNTSVILNYDTYNRFLNLNLTEIEKQNLERLGIIVEDDYNEEDAVLFASRNLNEKENVFFYRIYTTMACNAKCDYCYEKGLPISSMNYDTADKLLNFIESKLKHGMHVVLEWFGGEPLLNKKIITYISKNLENILKKYDATFSSNMVSNGFLFDNGVIKEAKEFWNLKKVQITLDGMKNYYESVKKFSSPNAFEKVIKNIKDLANNNIKVVIRLNYEDKNFNEILNLIEFLGNEFSNEGNVSVYARRIMSDDKDNSFKDSAKTDIIMYKALIKAKLVKPDNIIKSIPRRTNMCMAHMINEFIISPEGNLGKCSQALFENNKLGSITTDVNERELVKWCTPRLENKCLRCKLLPICNGGCLYEKFKNKNFCYYSEELLKYKLKTFLKYYIDKKQK